MVRPACYCLLFVIGACRPAAAQQHGDSLQQSLSLLSELVQAQNYEYAQLEAGYFLDYLQRNQLTCPAEAVPVLSKIYFHNEDKKSALTFFNTALDDACRNPNLEAGAQLLEALARAYYSDWEEYQAAYKCQQLLLQIRDSLATANYRLALKIRDAQIDSLSKQQQQDASEQARFVQIDRQHLAYLGGGLAGLFLLLLLLYSRSTGRFQKRLDKLFLENELLRSERFTTTLPGPEPALVPASEQRAQPGLDHADQVHTEIRPYRDKTALLIEPNRQIVLYLKSLLSDRFEVETAASPSEGLQLASNHLPDLIVCDAVLNGQTGIDIVRQIKLAERTNHIPVILLTERPGNEGKLDSLRAGADAWFNRPVLDRVFDEQVSQLLHDQQEKQKVFARFLHLYFSENRTKLDNPFLARTVEVIEQHLADPDFLADELSRKLQLHKQHFAKKLLALTGKEPVQLIREMRLEKAKALLEMRAGTPQAIAELVGFPSQGSFALAFKEYFGENTMLLQ